MADVNISKYRASVVRDGSKPASPGFVVSEGQDPVNPPGTNNFVPYTGATANVELGEFGVEAGFVTLDTTPTNIPTDQGAIYWDDTRSTAALIMNGTLQHIGQDSFFYVKNSSGSTIPKGTCVGFAGTDGGSGHLLVTPFLANGSVPSTYFMGVTSETIANGSFGQVMHFGELTGINTSGFTAGALLYASSTVAGAFQTTAPVAPNNIILVAAAVNSKNNGAIVVRPTLGSNINSDEGVKITSPTTGDLLQLQAGGLWENKTLAQVIGSAYVPSTRTLTINGTAFDLSANRSWTVGDMLLNTYQVVTGTKVFGTNRLIMEGEGTAQPTSLSNTQTSNSALTSHNSFGFNGSNNIYFNKGTTANGGIFAFSNTATRTYTLKDASGTLAFTSDIPANPVGGTGTTNYLPKFTGTSTIGNSLVFDNGTNIGINTNTPNDFIDGERGMAILQSTNGRAVLSLVGTRTDANEALGRISFTNSNSTNIGSKRVSYISGVRGSTNNSAYLEFAVANDALGSPQMILSQLGNLLVGSSNQSSDNGARLQVSGVSASSALSLRNTSGGTLADFIITENTGLIVNSYEGASARSIDFRVANASALLIASTGAATFSSSVTAGGTLTANTGTGATFRAIFGGTNVVEVGNYNATDGYRELLLSGSPISFYTSNAGASSVTERMRITSGGNVLIGTTTDNGARLQVSGTMTVGSITGDRCFIGQVPTYGPDYTQFSHISRAGANQYSFLSGNAGDTYVNSVNAQPIYFRHNNVDLAIITSSGSVGIGTTSPATRLMVQDTANTYVAHFSGLNQANGIAIGTNFSNVAVIQGYTRTFSATNNISMQADGGNVLIGTTTDNGARLQVSGTATFSNRVFVDGNLSGNNIAFLKNASSNGYGLLIQGGTSTNYALFITDYIGTQIFQMLGNGAATFSSSVTAAEGIINGTSTYVLSLNNTAQDTRLQLQVNGTQTFQLSSSSSQVNIFGTANIPMIFYTNSTERMRITSGGNAQYTGDPFIYSNTSSGGTAVHAGLRFHSTDKYIRFFTNDLGRMDITSSGNVLIGTTTDGGYKLDVAGKARVNNSDGFFVQSGSQFRQMYFDGFSTLYFWNGSNQANLSSAGAWVNASDISIKKNIQDLNYSLSDLLSLKPKSYEMKLDNLKQIGFIAQEVEEIIPELVTTDNKGMKGLNYGNLTALLVKAIQELKQEIDTLKN